MTPNPMPLRRQLLLREVDQHRHLDCKHYDACLDVMAHGRRGGKGSWTCTHCPLFKQEESDECE